MNEINKASSLKQLVSLLNDMREQAAKEQKTTFERADFDLEALGVDVTDLPTFGGIEPADTTAIYSWDKTSIMVLRNDGGFMVKPRNVGE